MSSIRCFLALTVIGMTISPGRAQDENDTLTENLNGICSYTTAPNRTFTFDYTGESGVQWEIQTYYSPGAGGIDDAGGILRSGDNCGSVFWKTGRSGYIKGIIYEGITDLSFQVLSGAFQKDGYVKVLVDGFLFGQTDPIDNYQVETYTFHINTPGPLELELAHGVKEGSTYGGILVDNLEWTPKEGVRPFFQVETLEDFSPDMDTLKSVTDTVDIFLTAEGCLRINNEFVGYLGNKIDTAGLTLGSVVRLRPGDSCNLYWWGSAVPGADIPEGNVPVRVYLPANEASDTAQLISAQGIVNQPGNLSFINGNNAYDLVVFKLTEMNHEYRIRYAYDSYRRTTTSVRKDFDVPDIEFFPNPVRNHAYFKTGKTLESFDLIDLNGRVLFVENDPVLSGEGYYMLDLEKLDPGVWIIRFRYTDNSMDALKIIVE